MRHRTPEEIATLPPLARNLRLWRNLRGYTQEKLAMQLYMSVETIANIERGGTCRVSTVRLIASELNVKVSELFRGE